MEVPRRRQGPSRAELERVNNWRQEQKEVLKLLPHSILSKVPEWKEEHKELLITAIGDNWFVYRPPTLEEFDMYSAQTRMDLFYEPQWHLIEGMRLEDLANGGLGKCIEPNPFLVKSEELLVDKLLIFTTLEDMSRMPLDEFLVLKAVMLESSNFHGNNLSALREELGNVMTTTSGLLAIISKFFGTPPDKLKRMTALQLAHYVACIEGITGEPVFSTDKPKAFGHSDIATMGGSAGKNISDQVSKDVKQESALTKAIQAHKDNKLPDSAPDGVIHMDRENMELGSLGFSPERGANTALNILQDIKDQLNGR